MIMKTLRLIIPAIILILLAYFTFLMAQISWEYHTLDTDVGFLRIKQDYLEHTVWLTAFFTHAFTSTLVLLAGFTQFSRALQMRYRSAHRWLGRLYVFNILLITGPAGLIMGFYANGGVTSRIAFILLACLWWWTTLMAYRTIRTKQFLAHRRWMIYSFALTLSAISLRLWKMFFAYQFALPPMDIYRIVAWLGFVPNLVLAYLWLRAHPTPKNMSAKQA
jgi:hypothetical protein